MEIGSRAGSVAGIVVPASKVDVTASFEAVPTQLQPEASVRQVSQTEPVRFEPSDGLRERAILEKILERALQRSTDIDGRTKAVVHRVTDEATGEVVDQFPAEQVLKLRAYLRNEVDVKRDGGRIA
jgi:uncharacterized FlaG/YvyC family protein